MYLSGFKYSIVMSFSWIDHVMIWNVSFISSTACLIIYFDINILTPAFFCTNVCMEIHCLCTFILSIFPVNVCLLQIAYSSIFFFLSNLTHFVFQLEYFPFTCNIITNISKFKYWASSGEWQALPSKNWSKQDKQNTKMIIATTTHLWEDRQVAEVVKWKVWQLASGARI